MKQKIITLLALLAMVVGASAQDPNTYHVVFADGWDANGATVKLTHVNNGITEDLSGWIADGKDAPVLEGNPVTLTVTPGEGYALTSVKAETFMEGGEMRARTRGAGDADGITILGEVALTPVEGSAYTYTFTMPQANVRISFGYKMLATATDIEVLKTYNIVYNGQAQTPEIIVRYGSIGVTDEFDITYANNVKAAAADAENAPTVTITAKETSTEFTGSATKTFAIAKVWLYVESGITASDKAYDGTAAATIDCTNMVLNGKVGSDDVTVTGITGEFSWAYVDPDNYVHLNYDNATLSGDDASNYSFYESLSQQTAEAKITAAKMTVSATGYSGTYDGQLHGISVSVTGPEDYDISYGETADDCTHDITAFTEYDVCEKTVYYKVTANNYVDVTGSATIKITPKSVKVVSGITAADKDYDGNTAADIDDDNAVIEGAVEGETLSIRGVTGTFADAKPGEGKTVNLDYTNAKLYCGSIPADNYTLDKANSQKTTTASIIATSDEPGDDEPGTTVTENEDGTTTTKTVDISTDDEGTETKTVSEETKDKDGTTVKTVETETVTKADGSSVETLIYSGTDEEGTKKEMTDVTVTAADGSETATCQYVETNADGTTIVYDGTSNWDAEGNFVSSTETKTIETTDGDKFVTETTETRQDDDSTKAVETEHNTYADGSTYESETVSVTTDDSRTTTVESTQTDSDGTTIVTTGKEVTDYNTRITTKEKTTVETSPNGDVTTTVTKDDGQGNVETNMTEDVKPTLGEETTVTDPATGETAAYREIEDDNGYLGEVTGATIAVASAEAASIRLVKNTNTVEENGKVTSEVSKTALLAKASGKDAKLKLKNAMKGGTFKLTADKGIVKALKTFLRKLEKASGNKQARTRGSGSDDETIEIESGEDYEILTDGDLVLTLKTSESDVEISSITISEPEDEPDEPEPDETYPITIGKNNKTTFCGDKGLDFSGTDEVKAFIATGFDKNEGTIWLTRVKDVPAGVPVLIKGKANETYNIPVTDGGTSHYENMFVGNTSGASIKISETSEDGQYVNYYMSGGQFKSVSKSANIGNNKCYLQLPANFEEATTGEAYQVKIADSGKSSFAAPYDLDFTDLGDDLKAFTATGYDKGTRTIWLTRVMKVQQGEGLFLKGTAGKTYTIPSAGAQAAYENMIVGNTSGATIEIGEKSDDGKLTNYYLKGGTYMSVNGSAKIGNNKSYLQLPTYMLAGARSEDVLDNVENLVIPGTLSLTELETESMPLIFGSIGGDDDETTGIRTTDYTDDTDESTSAWYTLGGQRISQPTKPGLYIHNGKKIVIK